MDILKLEPSLEPPDEDKASTTSDDPVPLTPSGEDGGDSTIATVGNLQDASGVRYQFQSDTNAHGQVTYRVIQVTPDTSDGTHIVTPGSFPAQAVIQTGYSSTGSPVDNSGERFAYFQQGTTGLDQNTGANQDAVNAATIGAVTAAGGQFYVMMSPQDVLQGPRAIAPRTAYASKMEGRANRDERRRATHNEVERKRRDKINNWIVQLSKLVPDCTFDSNKSGSVATSSKGGILSRACDYISELRNANARMAESLKETERIQVDTELLRQQCEELKRENDILRAQLQGHGMADISDGAT